MKIEESGKQVENLLIKNYFDYVKYLQDHEWHRESINIYENLSSIVTVDKLKKNNEGIVIGILCPPGMIMSIMGSQSVPEGYFLENIRHFELKLADSNGIEINPDINIRILKHKILRNNIIICEKLYKDFSMLNYSESPNRFKNYVELFRFKDRIELKGEDSLKINVINPDVDIDVIKFNLGVDLWMRRNYE